jgi:hypothetical protein
MLLWNQISGLATSLALAIPFVQECDAIPGATGGLDDVGQDTWPDGDQPCCQQSAAPACEEPEVVDCVCSRDSFCCAVRWDEICAGQAGDYCGARCS